MNWKPKMTEKAVILMERANTFVVEVDRKAKKEEIKNNCESLFDVKVEKIRTRILNNKKYASIQLKKNYSAADLATKLGVI